MYSKILSHKNVPQFLPLNKRQVQNAAGGHAYPVSDMDQLDRFLVLGSTGGNYYFQEYELAKQNLDPVMRCIQADAVGVVRRTVEISKAGRAVKNDPAIFTLALVLKHGDEPARQAAAGAIVDVCRTGTHLLSLAAEVEGIGKGWGRSLKRGVARWFLDRDEDALAYQALKYAQRNGWALRDLLRLAHPKASESAVFQHILKGGVCGHPLIDAAESLKGLDPKTAAEMIALYRLPREAVPTELLNSPEVWRALLESMPMTAMVRNLGKMTQVGLVVSGSPAEAIVVEALGNPQRLRKARVHPLTLLVALAVYRSGRGIRGSLHWSPLDSVNAALSEAVGFAMESAPAMGLRTLVAIDVSGSMHTHVAGVPALHTHEAAACMAIAATKVERIVHTVAFSSEGRLAGNAGWQPLDVKGRRLDDVVVTLQSLGGGTDLALPLRAALALKEPVDLIQIYTDSETWAGRQHLDAVLDEYRRKRNPAVKLVVAAMTANRISVGDPEDPGILQAIGFDASLPQVISAFAGGASSAGDDE